MLKRKKRKEEEEKRKNNGKNCLPSSIIYYQCLCLCLCVLLFMLCFTFSFVNIKYKWAFHRILYCTRQYNTLHTSTYNKGGIWHCFLKYKWGVNNVMMLSCSIYSYMICWLGFYLYGQQFYATLIWERQLLYVYMHNCGILFSRCSNPFSWGLSTMWMYKPYIFIRFKWTHWTHTLYSMGFCAEKKAIRLCYDNVATSTIRTLTNGKMAFSIEKPTAFGFGIHTKEKSA